VKSISPTQKGDVNKLQVNIKSKFKIFAAYQPNGLTARPAGRQMLTFKIVGNRLVAQNPTPYFSPFLPSRSAGTRLMNRE
jgi:P pilus assembly chaperone PapD